MAKLTLSDIGDISTAPATLNANNAKIETALENTLSRDGTTPNEMNADLDMNNYRLYNLPAPTTDGEPLRKGDVVIQPEMEALYDQMVVLRDETAADAATAASDASSAAASNASSINSANTATTAAGNAAVSAQEAEDAAASVNVNLGLKYDKTGGTISGNASITGVLSLAAPPVITSAAVDQDGAVHLSRVNTFTNGSSDDKAAVQVALDNLATRGGGVLILPAGGTVRLDSAATYTADNPISIRSEGGRRGCTIDQRADSAFSFTGSGPSSNQAVYINGLRFLGNYNAATAAILATTVENMEVSNIRAAAGSGYWNNFLNGTSVRTSHFRDWYIRGDHGLGSYADKQGNAVRLSTAGSGSTDNQFDGLLIQGFQTAFNLDASGNPGNEGVTISNTNIVECGYGILWRHSSGGGYVPPMLNFVNGHMNCYRQWGDFANVAQVTFMNNKLELNSLYSHSDIGVSFSTVVSAYFAFNDVNFTQGSRNTVAVSSSGSDRVQAVHNHLNMPGSSLGIQLATTNNSTACYNLYTNGAGTGAAVSASGSNNDIATSNRMY